MPKKLVKEEFAVVEYHTCCGECWGSVIMGTTRLHKYYDNGDVDIICTLCLNEKKEKAQASHPTVNFDTLEDEV